MVIVSRDDRLRTSWICAKPKSSLHLSLYGEKVAGLNEAEGDAFVLDTVATNGKPSENNWGGFLNEDTMSILETLRLQNTRINMTEGTIPMFHDPCQFIASRIAGLLFLRQRSGGPSNPIFHSGTRSRDVMHCRHAA